MSQFIALLERHQIQLKQQYGTRLNQDIRPIPMDIDWEEVHVKQSTMYNPALNKGKKRLSILIYQSSLMKLIMTCS